MADTIRPRILITGAAAGIGLAIAHRLGRDNVELILSDKDAAGLQTVAHALTGAGVTVTALPGDLCEAAVIERVARDAGPLDGLVNCAGVYPVTSLFELSADEWDRVMNINLRTPFLLTRAIAQGMIAAGIAGSIVNISSTASVLARPGIAHYGASKAGLNQLTRVLAVELAPHGIRVNAILPGLMNTPMAIESRVAQGRSRAEVIAARDSKIPLRRKMGTGWDVANAALFLHSDEAGFITGQALVIDGGELVSHGH